MHAEMHEEIQMHTGDRKFREGAPFRTRVFFSSEKCSNRIGAERLNKHLWHTQRRYPSATKCSGSAVTNKRVLVLTVKTGT
jgi:hypothetical protein